MTTQPEAARVERGPITEVKRFALGMADLLERQGFTIAAAELRRLHEAHDWQYRMAGERLHRVEKLEAQRDALLEALKYHQEQTRPIQSTIDAIKAAEENT